MCFFFFWVLLPFPAFHPATLSPLSSHSALYSYPFPIRLHFGEKQVMVYISLFPWYCGKCDLFPFKSQQCWYTGVPVFVFLSPLQPTFQTPPKPDPPIFGTSFGTTGLTPPCRRSTVIQRFNPEIHLFAFQIRFFKGKCFHSEMDPSFP